MGLIAKSPVILYWMRINLRHISLGFEWLTNICYISDPHDDGGLHGLLPQWRLQRRALALQLLGQRPRRHLGGLRPRPARRVSVHVQRRHLALDCHRRHGRKHSGSGRGLCLHFLMNLNSKTHTYWLTHPASSVSVGLPGQDTLCESVQLHLFSFSWLSFWACKRCNATHT